MSFSLKANGGSTPITEPKLQGIKADIVVIDDLSEEATPEKVEAVKKIVAAKGLGAFSFKPKPSTESKEIVPSAVAQVAAHDKVQDAAPQESIELEELSPIALLPNEVPAAAVVRELTDDASPGVLKFVEMLDSVPKLFHDPDTLGQVIRNIMNSLSEEESFIEMVQPDDYQFIIRGMRDVLEGAAIKKASTKRKAGGKKKPKKTALDADDMSMLDDLLGI